MEKDKSACLTNEEQKLPESGAGSEFGNNQRKRSREKDDVETCELTAEHQSWILQINGKSGKR